MKLTARRGGFTPWPDYGSRLHRLCSLPPSERPGAARQYIAEALAGEPGTAVRNVSVSEAQSGELSISVSLRTDDGTVNLNLMS